MAQSSGPEAKAEGKEPRLKLEAKAESETPEAKSGRRIGVNCHVLHNKRGRTERRSFERSLYRFEGLKARSGPGCMKVHQAISNGGLAQLGERVLCKHEVIGSSPIFSTVRADSSAG